MSNPGLLLFQEAYANLKNNTSPSEDFRRRSLDLMLTRLSNYRCQSFPTTPSEVDEYRKETKFRQDQLDKDGFWRNSSQAYAWLMSCDKISGINRGRYGLLKEALSLDCITQDEQQTIKKVMLEFTGFWRKENERTGYKPMIVMTEEQESELSMEQLNPITEIFGGEITEYETP